MDTELPQIQNQGLHEGQVISSAISSFVEWNGLLLAHFFSPTMKGEETWLQTAQAELDSIGLRLGGAQGLIDAVREGPIWLGGYQNIASAATRLMRQRVNSKSRSPDYVDPGEVDETYKGYAAPTYLPYLALWVMASSESSGEGFYAVVQRMSGRPFPSSSPTIRNEMLLVWKDLEAWTCSIEEAFGRFAVRVLGEHQYVGMPRSQCLISRKDRSGLPHLFCECGLRPGQGLSSHDYNQIASIAAEAYYLSKGLQDAFRAVEYADPLKRMLIAALQSWNGKVPHSKSGGGSAKEQTYSAYEDEADEISVVLRPGQCSINDWEIHWRIPLVGAADRFYLACGEFKWEASIEEAGTHALSLATCQQSGARQVLAKTLDSNIEFTVSYTEAGDENGVSTSRLVLCQRSIRTLAWDAPDPSYGSELIEGQIPLRGLCYLLFHTKCKDILNNELSESRAKWEPMDATGLPDEWEMGCIHYSDLLTAEQRKLISDVDDVDHELARIRLVGGRPILRGGGKTYAYYDLPILELEAPPEALPISEGLEISELRSSIQFDDNYIGIRRYGLRITDPRRALFQIYVIGSGAIRLASITLKISIAAGTAIAPGRNFGVGPLGRPSSIGLRLVGVLQEENGSAISGRQPGTYFDATGASWKPLENIEGLMRITDSVAARFLDSLAQLGSIAFGNARDQLQRLARQANLSVTPALLLLDLRGRGYLELETDDHGHLVRVHAVPPTFYSLPVQRNGRIARAICGTFRLQSILDMGAYLEGKVLIDGSSPRLPWFCIAPESEEDFSDCVEILGFRSVQMPASPIADWATGLVDARSTLSSWDSEYLATEFRQLQRFQPGSAEFRSQSGQQLTVDQSLEAELYRFEDPIVQSSQVYVLGTIKEGRRRFSFMQDSRWGVWLAMNSFAGFVSRYLGNSDAVPWPIHYSPHDGTFWLPARMRPPFVIERVLVLCSGDTPNQIKFGGQGVDWSGRLHRVYAEMSDGIWLAYRWVPTEIAIRVASMLGGRINYI